MKSGEENAAKEVYRQLRVQTCRELWEEAARFDQAAPRERLNRVGLVRAMGVVFAESGTVQEKDAARQWLLGLLNDPTEKIRRYAMAALPKLGSGPSEEKALLALLQRTQVDREKEFLGRALDKIGGMATLEAINLLPQVEQKVRANIARSQSPSAIRMDRDLSVFAGLRIHLRSRKGLEEQVRSEVEESIQLKRGKFRIAEVRSGLVAITPVTSFSIADIYAFRCFGSVGFVLGTVKGAVSGEAGSIEAIASVITSALSLHVLEAFTEGSLRYRLNFVGDGVPKGAVRLVADRAYALCPAILNDASNAPWVIDIHPSGQGASVELRPRLTPDPRLFYRQRDVPAASHPPLAACMARLAGKMDHEIVWDPFCGSGLELIERALLGGVRMVYGTDRSEDAVAITRMNFEAAKVDSTQATFACCDFRDFMNVKGLGPGSVTLLITNPPMGKRIPIPNLHGLIEDLFAVAFKVLRPGGRLVFANPLRIDSPYPTLKLQSRTVVDFGGFNCRLEMYLKTSR